MSENDHSHLNQLVERMSEKVPEVKAALIQLNNAIAMLLRYRASDDKLGIELGRQRVIALINNVIEAAARQPDVENMETVIKTMSILRSAYQHMYELQKNTMEGHYEWLCKTVFEREDIRIKKISDAPVMYEILGEDGSQSTVTYGFGSTSHDVFTVVHRACHSDCESGCVPTPEPS